MRIVIFGASGGTGSELVRQALIRGDLEVTAFVRDAGSLEPASRLRIVTGDALNDTDVAQAIAGQDAVLSALGGDVTDRDLLQRCMSNIIAGMKQTRVERLIVLSAAGAVDGDAALAEQNVVTKTVMKAVNATLLKAPMQDHAAQDHLIVDSGLRYTIVNPPRLTDSEQTGHYRVDETALPAGATSISRADVAEFMLDQLDSPKFENKAVFIGV